MISFFHKIVDVLQELNIPYMLSGSVAMSVYIVPRATRDFDFVVYLKQTQIDSFTKHFNEGYYCNAEAVLEAVKYHSMFNIIDHKSGYKADFIILKNEEFRQEEFKRRVEMKFYEKTVHLVSVEDLLLSKLIWIQELQSALQMEDIRNLNQLETLDRAYINKWIAKLKLNTFNLLEQ